MRQREEFPSLKTQTNLFDIANRTTQKSMSPQLKPPLSLGNSANWHCRKWKEETSYETLQNWCRPWKTKRINIFMSIFYGCSSKRVVLSTDHLTTYYVYASYPIDWKTPSYSTSTAPDPIHFLHYQHPFSYSPSSSRALLYFETFANLKKHTKKIPCNNTTQHKKSSY